MKFLIPLSVMMVMTSVLMSQGSLLMNLDNISLSDLSNITSGNANDDIDYLLMKFKSSLPSVAKAGNLHPKWAYDCVLTGLSTGMHRHGDAILDVIDHKAVFSFGISTNRITIQCKWKQRIPFHTVRGTVTAYTNKISVRAKFSLDMAPGSHSTLDEFRVTELQKIKTDVKGSGTPLNWITEKILNRVAKKFRGRMIWEVEQKVREKLQRKLLDFKVRVKSLITFMKLIVLHSKSQGSPLISFSDLRNITSGNINADIDYILQRFNSSLPSVVYLGDFHYDWAYNCSLTGLNNGITRFGEAVFDVTDNNATLSLGLSTSRITTHCRWREDMFFYVFHGTVNANTDKISVSAELSLNLAPGAHPILNEFKVTELQNITTDVQGTGIMNAMTEEFVNLEENRLIIIKEIERNFQLKLQRILQDLKLPNV